MRDKMRPIFKMATCYMHGSRAWHGTGYVFFELCNVVQLVLVVQRRHIGSCTFLTGAWFGICIGPLAYMVVLGGFGVFMGVVVTRHGVVIDRKWLVDIQACNI